MTREEAKQKLLDDCRNEHIFYQGVFDYFGLCNDPCSAETFQFRNKKLVVILNEIFPCYRILYEKGIANKLMTYCLFNNNVITEPFIWCHGTDMEKHKNYVEIWCMSEEDLAILIMKDF